MQTEIRIAFAEIIFYLLTEKTECARLSKSIFDFLRFGLFTHRLFVKKTVFGENQCYVGNR